MSSVIEQTCNCDPLFCEGFICKSAEYQTIQGYNWFLVRYYCTVEKKWAKLPCFHGNPNEANGCFNETIHVPTDFQMTPFMNALYSLEAVSFDS
jgi:hypothetical protein